MKKTSQKIFSKVTALMLAAVSGIGFSAKAEKPPFPRGEYRIYNVAVIGNNVTDDKAVEESPGFNKSVIDNLCNVGTKLENYAEVEILEDENKISLAGRELPRSSMILPEKRIIFCFYDVANVYTNPEVIKECLYALCPYALNLSESYDAWGIRMTRLRDFVKERNEMCDLRFLGVIQGNYTEKTEKYSLDTLKIADKRLDIYEYEQTVTAWCLSPHENYRELIATCVQWGGAREREFKQCMSKNVPIIIINTGMSPVFFQEGEEHSVSAPPIVPRVQSTKPITPQSKASEGSKKNPNKWRIPARIIGAGAGAVALITTSYILISSHLNQTENQH